MSIDILVISELEFEQILGVSDRQGTLLCCSPWALKELDTTERTELNQDGPERANLIKIIIASTTVGKNPLEEME